MDWSELVEMVRDLLTVGAVGFLGGVLIPLAFRVIGFIVDSVRAVSEIGGNRYE